MGKQDVQEIKICLGILECREEITESDKNILL